MFTFDFVVHGDVITFSETKIKINAEDYPEAIKKVKALKLPELRAYDEIAEVLKLESIYEWDWHGEEEDLEL